MDVRIQLLRQFTGLRETLAHDGWRVEPTADGSLSACHPQVPNEVAARSRLLGLGLLTSGSVRIEFRPPLGKQ
jgi:hypothetical protein